LNREITIQGQTKKQLEKVPTGLQLLHDEICHSGRELTVSLTKEKFYWPGMSRDSERWIMYQEEGAT
jgi:hypothetical protein